jgi:hypothetical protein
MERIFEMAAEMGSSTMMYISSVMNIGSENKKLIWEGGHRHHGRIINIIAESRIKISVQERILYNPETDGQTWRLKKRA